VQCLGQEGLSPDSRPEKARRSGGRARLFGIAGYKNSGKTTLIVALVRELVARGWRVGTLKHAHHEFDIDHPGKDSFLHRAAGATEVIVASTRRVAHIRELTGPDEPSLDELVRELRHVDLALVEGWKAGNHPRLELRRTGVPAAAIAGAAPGVVAIVSDTPLEDERVPVLLRGNVPAIADFILSSVGLSQAGD
jgi:molybdopterin-guanine dinucleotide biosynthesis protein B